MQFKHTFLCYANKYFLDFPLVDTPVNLWLFWWWGVHMYFLCVYPQSPLPVLSGMSQNISSFLNLQSWGSLPESSLATPIWCDCALECQHPVSAGSSLIVLISFLLPLSCVHPSFPQNFWSSVSSDSVCSPFNRASDMQIEQKLSRK